MNRSDGALEPKWLRMFWILVKSGVSRLWWNHSERLFVCKAHRPVDIRHSDFGRVFDFVDLLYFLGLCGVVHPTCATDDLATLFVDR